MEGVSPPLTRALQQVPRRPLCINGGICGRGASSGILTRALADERLHLTLMRTARNILTNTAIASSKRLLTPDPIIRTHTSHTAIMLVLNLQQNNSSPRVRNQTTLHFFVCG